MRIAVIAPSRHPLRQPHAGGLERMVWERVRGLRAAGHEVVLCAPAGSDFLRGGPPQLRLPEVRWPDARSASDVLYPPGHVERMTDALRAALAWIAADGGFDVVDSHSLDGVVITAAAELGLPLVTTLHTPPFDAMAGAHRDAPGASRSFLAVSEHTRAAWAAEGVPASVLPNAFDARTWSAGRGGAGLVWSGRLVPEKAPHLALDAARAAGLPITLAGRIGDHDYVDAEVRPRLGAGARYVGPLGQRRLDRLIGAADCALVTPMWEEPFGLVVAEALATGTPVAAFGNGGVREVVAGSPAAVAVPPGDVDALAGAAALLAAQGAAVRRAVRADALRRFSFEARLPELELRLRLAAARQDERTGSVAV
jgi:glycosyltransferase involved in cell wall biosynthesis